MKQLKILHLQQDADTLCCGRKSGGSIIGKRLHRDWHICKACVRVANKIGPWSTPFVIIDSNGYARSLNSTTGVHTWSSNLTTSIFWTPQAYAS